MRNALRLCDWLSRVPPQVRIRARYHWGSVVTINVALVTREAVILGCDSLSSVSEFAFFPYRPGAQFAKDAKGDLIRDASGNLVISVAHSDVREVAINVFDGAKKMTCIYEDDDTKVAIVTAGEAVLNGQTISDLARLFTRGNTAGKTTFTTVQDVASAFGKYMREQWERHTDYKNVDSAMRPYLPNVQFLVGGINRNDTAGSVYRLSIADDTCDLQFPASNPYGLCWAGQADHVQRLVLGFDNRLQEAIERQFESALQGQQTLTLSELSDALQSANVELPDNLNVTLTPVSLPALDWNAARPMVDYANMPMQHAVDFVSLLVNTQSGIQKFASGIATVGGRTHIGVIRRDEQFRMLNEPELVHAHTGYSHDA